VSELNDHAAAEHASRQALLKRISREMSAIQAHEFGKGPVSARSYLFDDLLQVVMRDGLTVAEKTRVRFGRRESVRAFRQQFQDEMSIELMEFIEHATER
jgi:uncharacterized protein YbcI